MSFETSNDKEIIKYIKSILDSQSKMNLKITGISKINNAVIWLNIEETEKLRKIHNLLNEKLQEEYSIPLKQFDGENFRFHSTLFQDEKICDEHELLLRELNYKLNFPIEIKINEINFGISEKGEVGTFTIIDKLNLK